MNPVISYGIALLRKTNNINKCKKYVENNVLHEYTLHNNYEILFIKKRTTYAYIAFVKGIYKYNKTDILRLLDNMTNDEKCVILSMNFSYIWFKSYLISPSSYIKEKDIKKYEKCRNIFERNFKMRKNIDLIELISKSEKTTKKIWEIPKGMSQGNESEINTAIREFYEETGISKDKYHLLYNVDPIIYDFKDENVRYRYIYYLAVLNMDEKIKPKITVDTTKNVTESIDICFYNINQIRLFYNRDKDKPFIIFIKKILKIIKQYYKNNYIV